MTFACYLCYTVHMGRRGLYQRDAVTAARRLREWRRLKAITQEELAAVCRVSRMTVIRWEDPGCEYSPGLTHLIRINRAWPNEMIHRLARPPEEGE